MAICVHSIFRSDLDQLLAVFSNNFLFHQDPGFDLHQAKEAIHEIGMICDLVIVGNSIRLVSGVELDDALG